MAGDMFLRIHHFASIIYHSRSRWSNTWQSELADVPSLAEIPGMAQEVSAQLHVVDAARLQTDGMSCAGDGILFDRNSLVDTRCNVRLTVADEGYLTLHTHGPALEWLNWLIQLMLLRSGATFVHAAAAEKAGVALLFPAWRNTGKTSVVSGLVRDFGWRFLGDDKVILTSQGLCYGFPRPMFIYKYHQKLFPDLFRKPAKHLVSGSLVNLITRIGLWLRPTLIPFPRILQFLRTYNPQSMQVPPSTIFSTDKLADRAAVKAVLYLNRVQGLAAPVLRSPDKRLISRLFGSTFADFDPWCAHVLNIGFGLGLLQVEDFFAQWLDVLAQALDGCHAIYYLDLPSSLPAEQVAAKVHDLLVHHKIIA